mgnify:CR=1 FL=1
MTLRIFESVFYKSLIRACSFDNWYVMTFVNSKLTEITTNFYFIVSEDIQKEFRCISSRHWPLWYTWIGYLQANGPPGALLSKGVDHGFTCTHREVADNSNLEVITTLFRYCQIFVLLLAEICTPLLISACLYNTLWTVGCQELKPLLRCAALLTG